VMGVLGGISGIALIGAVRGGLGVSELPKFLGGVGGLPGSWFGGSWFNRGVLESVEPADVVTSYTGIFAIVFVLIILRSLYRLVMKEGAEAAEHMRPNE
jgi:hypothetical protein